MRGWIAIGSGDEGEEHASRVHQVYDWLVLLGKGGAVFEGSFWTSSSSFIFRKINEKRFSSTAQSFLNGQISLWKGTSWFVVR